MKMYIELLMINQMNFTEHIKTVNLIMTKSLLKEENKKKKLRKSWKQNWDCRFFIFFIYILYAIVQCLIITLLITYFYKLYRVINHKAFGDLHIIYIYKV